MFEKIEKLGNVFIKRQLLDLDVDAKIMSQMLSILFDFVRESPLVSMLLVVPYYEMW